MKTNPKQSQPKKLRLLKLKVPKLNIPKNYITPQNKITKPNININNPNLKLITPSPINKQIPLQLPKENYKLLSNGQNYVLSNNNNNYQYPPLLQLQLPLNNPTIPTYKPIISPPHYNTTHNTLTPHKKKYRKLNHNELMKIRNQMHINKHNNEHRSHTIMARTSSDYFPKSRDYLNTMTIPYNHINSNNNNKHKKVIKRSQSTKQNVLRILNETINGLKALKIMIQNNTSDNDNEYNYDSNSSSNENGNNTHIYDIKRYLNCKQVKENIENSIINMNKLIQNTFNNKEMRHKRNKSIVNEVSTINRTIDSECNYESLFHNNNKYKHAKNTTSLYNDYYNRNCWKGNRQKEYGSGLDVTMNEKSLIRIRNPDKEIPVKINGMKKNNSELYKNIVKENDNYHLLKKKNIFPQKNSHNTNDNNNNNNKCIDNKTSMKLYDSGIESLANFEFSD